MKLKNPYLYTSFYIVRDSERIHVNALKVICDYSNITEKFYYHVYFRSFENGIFSLGNTFFTAEEAFTVADKICSLYPPIESDLDCNHFDDYPEFKGEDFLK